MKQFLKIVWMMMVEEWRSHSRIYRGHSFALFPVLVFIFAAAFSYFTVNYSTLNPEILDAGLLALGGMFGLAAGTIGFYGRDAFQNVLGQTEYLVYTSQTLPLSGRKLGAAFLIKDILYYSLILTLPVTAGFAVFHLPVIYSLPEMMGFFSLAAALSLSISHFTRPRILKPEMDLPIDSLTNKAFIDVSRSTGGFLKIIFSLGLLTFFYWYFVFFFPIANAFLRNPLLSFSVVVGIANLSVYNWINRFDSLKDYDYLPVKYRSLVDSKKKAYTILTLPLTTLLILVAYLFYPGDLFLALLIGYTTTMYSLVVVEKLTKLKPNIRFYQTGTFIKFLIIESIVIVPLLFASVIYRGIWIEIVVFSMLILFSSALIEEHW
ncbi:hypothetical protein [Candidatus Nanohalobium constans]|uniref:ABC transporter permease n=1 Tax=Candidatus Nanohalobium constans TaxID=2565781 RepID=A0A5Q0UHJ5_9ARCH|nr:hypothetical protein [Candidatus Nanohalobium constans]QGA80415.1 hypothetical protein LC1Nh_0515 [Candidatus Nanohalobium constans]